MQSNSELSKTLINRSNQKQQQQSFCRSCINFFFCCFTSSQQQVIHYKPSILSTQQNQSNIRPKDMFNRLNQQQKNQFRKKNNMFFSANQKITNADDYKYLYERRLSISQPGFIYAVSHYIQNELILIGVKNQKLICKITHKKINPSKRIIEKIQENLQKQKNKSIYFNENLNKLWANRYLLFQKFDNGIKLDQETWESVTPEAISQYLSERATCKVILDAFCGVGGDSIKFANTCTLVKANDIDMKKIQYLNINANVYGAQNIITYNCNFMQLTDTEADVVYLCPKRGPLQFSEEQIDPTDYFNPSMSEIFSKSLQISNNIIMLLPPNIKIDLLVKIISQNLSKLNKCVSCSIQIEKIYFMDHLRFLVIYYGAVNKEIQLHDELELIYNMLNQQQQQKFSHKKIIKQIREKYGMIKLLNLVLNACYNPKTNYIDNFYKLIRDNHLIQDEKIELLQKYQNYQKNQMIKKNQLKERQEHFQSEGTRSYLTNERESPQSSLQSRIRSTIVIRPKSYYYDLQKSSYQVR